MEVQEMNHRIEELLKQITLEEKIKMIHGDALFYSGGVERLQIPPIHMSDGPMGVRNEFPRDSWVPVGHSDDYVTYCPSNSAIAATFNRQLAYESGKVLGEEARGRGKDVILGPGINIKRIPANGRNFEYMSEDPYLISQLVTPLIQGIQESDVAACVKHFALNNQETERLWVNVEIDERALREIYLPGFEAAVKLGKSHTIMGAYNLFRGVHCCENQELLGEILRKEWDYDGVVISDWGAVHDTEAAANSSLDIEMSVTYDFDQYKMAEPLYKAVKEGKVKEEVLDEKIRHILLLMFRLKMIEAAGETSRKSGCYNTPKHREKVLSVAEESIVLLKNDENRLPLDPAKQKKLLVIGDNADRLHSLGGGSAEIKALYEISPLMGIKSFLGGNTKVKYSKGYYVSPKEERDTNWQEDSISENAGEKDKLARKQENSKEILAQSQKLRDEAVALAKQIEDVILIVGLNHDYDVEGYDREDMQLPYDQALLIQEVLAANENTIVVVRAGNAVSMGQWKDKAKAILWEWYDGMEGGNALAKVIFGNVNPSGKLPESMPYCMEDCGAIALGEYPGRSIDKEDTMNAHTTMTYKDSIYVGYRYYEKYQVPVQYPFGHGLSYTEFEYSDIKLKKTEQNTVQVLVRITNTGTRSGKEIVQVYVGKKDSIVERPIKELKGFEKISLLPGESKLVKIILENQAFSYFDVTKQAFTIEPGEYEIYIGKSLTDIQAVLTCNL